MNREAMILKDRRAELKLTQQELAVEAGISFTFFFICFYAAFAHCWARLFFLSSVAKPGFFVLWVLKERNDTCSFRLERSHDKRAETPD